MKIIFFVALMCMAVAGVYGQRIDYQYFEKNASKETVFQVGHASEITVSALSSDGALGFTGARDGIVKIWKMPELYTLRTIATEGLPITSMTVTPDGKYIAYSNLDKNITLLSTQTGAVYKTLNGHTASVASVHCNPEGTFLASTSFDRSVRIWHIPSGITYMNTKNLNSAGTVVAFSDDGKLLAVGLSNGEVLVFDVKGKKSIISVQPHSERITGIAFSSEGSFVLTSDKNGVLMKTMITTATSRSVVRVPSPITSFVVENDTHCLITTEDGKLSRYNIDKSAMLFSLQAHRRSATCISYYQKTALLLTGGDDMNVRVWKIGSKDLIAQHTPHDDWITSAAFSNDGTLLATGSKDKTIKIWRYPSMENSATYIGHGDEVTSIAFSPNGKYFASSSKDSTIRLWNIVEKMTISVLQGHKGWVLHCAFSPDGNMIASSGEDGAIMIWDVATARVKKTLRHHKGWVTAVAFSPDGTLLFSAGHDKTVKITSLETGVVKTTLTGPSGSIEQICVSKDGTLLAAAEQFNKAYVWSLQDNTLRCAVNAHTGALTSVHISANNTMFATGGADKTVKLWKIDGTLLKTFTEHSREISQVLFSADDTTVVSVGRDKALCVWSTSECVPLVSESSVFTPITYATNRQDKQAYIFDNRVLILPDKKYITVESGSSLIAISDSILAAATQKSILFYLIASGDLIAEHLLSGGIKALSFSSDGKTLYFINKKGEVYSYELISKKETAITSIPKNILKIEPLSNGIAVISDDGAAGVSIKNSKSVSLQVTGTKIIDIAVDGDASLVYTLNDNRTLSTWKIDGTLVKTVKVSLRIPIGITLLGGGKTIAIIAKEPGIKIVRAVDGVTVTTIAEQSTFVSLHATNEFIIASIADKSIVVMRQSGKDYLRMFMLRNNHVFEYNGNYEYSKELLPFVRVVQGYSIVPKSSFISTTIPEVVSMFFK